MKPKFILPIVCGFILLVGNVSAQDFKTTTINKQVKDFPDRADLTTPLNASITCTYIQINGADSAWRTVSSYSLQSVLPSSKASRKIVPIDKKEKWLNDTIKEVIVYKDSIACVIQNYRRSNYVMQFLGLENGKWVNMGQELGEGLDGARQRFGDKAPSSLARLYRIKEMVNVPTDTLAFTGYVKKYGKAPKEFLLDALREHKLVIYGEQHRRKLSWDLLRATLNDPRFCKMVGTVFVELPSNQQSELDRFFESKTLDTEILLNVMRAEQVYGMWDRGEYEFLIDFWKLNQTLPEKERIKVIATDSQLPYKMLKTPEEYEECIKTMPDRNGNMASVIEQTIKSEASKRNYLFTVGYSHARKSEFPGVASSYGTEPPQPTAGNQLLARFPKGDVFVVFQHCIAGTNSGHVGKIRNGFFDAVFAKLDDQPVAFSLQNSPFGDEPFDAEYDICFESNIGSYADNFDGYIFLGPLKDEGSQYVLYDIWSDEFVEEMKRRAELAKTTVKNWFKVDEVSSEAIIRYFKSRYEGKKPWSHFFE